MGTNEEFGNDVPEWSRGRRGDRFGEHFPTPKWSNGLKRWTETIADEYFILLQIDYFLYRRVDLELIERLKQYLNRENVVKIDLSSDRSRFPHDHYELDGEIQIIVSKQEAQFRSSLQAAIWKKNYLASMLKPDRNPWDFERYGGLEHMNDGKLILGVANLVDGPVAYLNVYSNGRVKWHQLQRLGPTVLAELHLLGFLGSGWNGF